MKKVLALCLAVLMLMLTVAGCGKGGETATDTTTTDPTQNVEDVQGAVDGGYEFPILTEDDDGYITIKDDDQQPAIEVEKLGNVTKTSTIQHSDMKYVMVYNPYIYDENLNYNDTLSTGKLDQIVVDMQRADGLEEIPEDIPFGQDQFDVDFKNGPEGDRGSVMGREFKKGDKEAFYVFKSTSTEFPRQQKTFTCVYSGLYCNIWSMDKSVTEQEAKTAATEFDTNIYTKMIEKFGEPRFDSKVNFLCYPMQDGLNGCFANVDLFTQAEVDYLQIGNMGCNTSVNVLHINSKKELTDEKIISTLAHEFQHLICFSNAFETVAFNICRTWINEAMSGYVEEMIFPGIQYKAGRMESLMKSDMIRYGQSMYNFATNTASAKTWDIGVYGSVYLYAMYLEGLAGDDVFTKFHKYWRSSYSETLSEAEALVYAMPTNVFNAVDDSITYPSAISANGFNSAEEEWMSKLTLQYYLDLLDKDEYDPADFANVDPQKLLYDQKSAAQIEGGGRIIFQVKGGSYKIPAGSDEGLIYVALDKDFNVLSVSYN